MDFIEKMERRFRSTTLDIGKALSKEVYKLIAIVIERKNLHIIRKLGDFSYEHCSKTPENVSLQIGQKLFSNGVCRCDIKCQLYFKNWLPGVIQEFLPFS